MPKQRETEERLGTHGPRIWVCAGAEGQGRSYSEVTKEELSWNCVISPSTGYLESGTAICCLFSSQALEVLNISVSLLKCPLLLRHRMGSAEWFQLCINPCMDYVPCVGLEWEDCWGWLGQLFILVKKPSRGMLCGSCMWQIAVAVLSGGREPIRTEAESVYHCTLQPWAWRIVGRFRKAGEPEESGMCLARIQSEHIHLSFLC